MNFAQSPFAETVALRFAPLARSLGGADVSSAMLHTTDALSSDLLVVAPHPGDAVVSAAGAMLTALERGFRVRVVAVSDGEDAPISLPKLGALRRIEQTVALRRLGLAEAPLRLRVPDREAYRYEDVVGLTVRSLTGAGEARWTLVVPRPGEGDDDHEACGRAVLHACADIDAGVVHYTPASVGSFRGRGKPHLGRGGDSAPGRRRHRRMALAPRHVARKRHALGAFYSLIGPHSKCGMGRLFGSLDEHYQVSRPAGLLSAARNRAEGVGR